MSHQGCCVCVCVCVCVRECVCLCDPCVGVHVAFRADCQQLQVARLTLALVPFERFDLLWQGLPAVYYALTIMRASALTAFNSFVYCGRQPCWFGSDCRRLCRGQK